MRTHLVVTAAATVAALFALTACGTGDSAGTAERTPDKAADAAPAEKGDGNGGADCDDDSDLEQSEWREKCADDAGADDVPETELKIGDTFKYPDRVRATVTSINRLSQFGEFDDRPDADEVAFRVTVTIKNDSRKPVRLDDFGIDASGAVNGGNITLLMVEAGSKELMGRVAPGATATGTGEFAIGKENSSQVVASVSRSDTDTILDEDPSWTGPIR